MIAVALLSIVINILMAWWHSVLIKNRRPIKHGYWGGGYFVLSSFLGVFFASIPLFLFFIISRKPVFDPALNLFRGKKWNHISRTTTSMIDDIHVSLFDDGHWYYYLYALISISILFTL